MPLQFFDSIFVNNGLLQSTFQLPEALFTFFSVGNGSGFFNANLQMTHEGLNTRFFCHDSRTRAVPHQSLHKKVTVRLG